MTTPQVDREVAALRLHKFTVKPWWMQQAIDKLTGRVSPNMRIVERGTCGALIQILPNAINIVGLHNHQPGNGQFTNMVDDFEAVAEELRIILRVVEFHNDRLYQWFVRRGYNPDRNKTYGRYVYLHPILSNETTNQAT